MKFREELAAAVLTHVTDNYCQILGFFGANSGSILHLHKLLEPAIVAVSREYIVLSK